MWSPLSLTPPERGAGYTKAGKEERARGLGRQTVGRTLSSGRGQTCTGGASRAPDWPTMPTRDRRCWSATRNSGRYVERDEAHLLSSRHPRGRGEVEAGGREALVGERAGGGEGQGQVLP